MLYKSLFKLAPPFGVNTYWRWKKRGLLKGLLKEAYFKFWLERGGLKKLGTYWNQCGIQRIVILKALKKTFESSH